MLQQSIDAVTNILRDVGMQAAHEKSEYIGVLNSPNIRKQPTLELFSLNPNNQPIPCKSSIRVLGLHIDQVSQATTWVTNTIKTIKQILRIIKRFTTHQFGLKEHALRHLTHTLLI
ncbi:hypothetical protein HPB48_013512 [Haemaphysalis longicornis]|uniref:Uncharacterized protein n=1 Tax=Haemaphysalis longicornis TaxID=44386 RepID=A0A9J6GV94_HAELO|nr:hypothetical protein HPB48_013512 [Haemaphysalis longicornis]